MFALNAADRAVEIEAEIGPIVERVLGRQVLIACLVLGNAGERGEGEFIVAEEQVAVATLEAGFRLDRHACAGEATAGPAGERPRETVGKARGMCAAAHGFAMSVEDQRGDVCQAIGLHRFGKAALQAFDGERCGDLAHEAASVGKAGLDRDAAAQAGVAAVGFFRKQRFEETTAMFQRGLCLEQGRDIDLAFDAEQLGEIERGKHCLRLLAFGDQHADRRVGVDVLEHLRHDQELAHRGAGFDRQSSEVDAQRLHVGQEFAQTRQRALAAEVQRAFGVDPAAQGVEQLRRVHAEVDPADAEAIGAHGSSERGKRDGLGLVRIPCLGFQRLDQRSKAEKLGLVVRAQAVGGSGKRFGAVERRGEQLRHFRRMGVRRIERGEERVCLVDAAQGGGVAAKA